MSVSDLAAEICTYLQTVGSTTPPLVYTGAGTPNLWSSQMPDLPVGPVDVPDLAALITPAPGQGPVGVITQGLQTPLKLARPQVVVTVRAGQQQYTQGWTLIESIFGALHGLTGVQLNPPSGAFFHWIYALTSPRYLGAVGGRERHLFTQTLHTYWEDPALL